jgi:hypothetical protein
LERGLKLEESKSKSFRGFEFLILFIVVAAIIVVLVWEPAETEAGATDSAADMKKLFDRPDADALEPPTFNYVYLPFRDASKGLPEKGQWRGDPTAADVNHDGHTDVIASLRKLDKDRKKPTRDKKPQKPTDMKTENTPESGLYVFLGDGEGNWKKSTDGITSGLGYGGAEVADINNDGHPDIAFSTHCGPAVVYLGDGKGAWTSAGEGIDNPTILQDVTVADFTGDGHKDLVGLSQFPDRGGRIYCFENRGDGTWQRMHDEPLMREESFGSDICSEDIDQDGDMDLIAATDKGLKVFVNDGTGQFEDRSLGLAKPSIGNSLTSVACGDINGDGDIEIVVGAFQAEDQPGLEVYESVDPAKEEGLYWKRLYEGPYRKDYVFGLDLGDLDGDKDLDLVVASNSREQGSRVTVFENDGTGMMTEKGCIEGATGRSTIDLADFNGDGRLDVLTVFSANDGGVKVYLQE